MDALKPFLNVITHGDSLEVLPQLPAESVDLVVTSPPYFDIANYANFGEGDIGKKQSLDAYLGQMGQIFVELHRVLKPSKYAHIIIREVTKKRETIPLDCYMVGLAKEAGFTFEERKGMRILAWAMWDFNLIFRKGVFNWNRRMTDKWDEGYWDIHSEFRAERARFKFDHPATFIEAVPRIILGKWSREGDVVLDPFSGTGTTAMVAKEMRRNFIAVELSGEYVDLSRKRLARNRLSKYF